MNRTITSLFTIALMALSPMAKANQPVQETYMVTQVPSENGSYTVTPEIPKNGEVAAGTELTVFLSSKICFL